MFLVSQAALNVDAVEMWRKPEWDNTYHESGVLMLATKGTAGEKYTDSSYENVSSAEVPLPSKKS